MRIKKTMRTKKILLLSLSLGVLLLFLSFNALAVTFSLCSTLNKEGYCEITGRDKQREPYVHIVHCGSSYLTIRAKDKATLNAYLKSHKNMIVKYHRDKFFIDGHCF